MDGLKFCTDRFSRILGVLQMLSIMLSLADDDRSKLLAEHTLLAEETASKLFIRIAIPAYQKLSIFGCGGPSVRP